MSYNSDGRTSSSRGSVNSKNSNGHCRQAMNPIHHHQSNVTSIPSLLQVKSKFDAEWRRFSLSNNNEAFSYDNFRRLVEQLHHLESVPFTLCYNSAGGDLLPITNDERKGESWEEKYGYGTDSDRIEHFRMKFEIKIMVPEVVNIVYFKKRKGLSSLIAVQKPPRRNYSISNPEDFRQVSAIIDVDIVPEAHRRVRLCKHGSERPLGFYIRDGTSVRVTERGVAKVQGIFISRLVDGGLAESTGLLGVNDEHIFEREITQVGHHILLNTGKTPSSMYLNLYIPPITENLIEIKCVDYIEFIFL
uniref:PDZ domain-containing protein n=1 Tax=Heterorhabditis bacteriophora TaxID=37862 RepID=A0A1I7XI52_HETBA